MAILVIDLGLLIVGILLKCVQKKPTNMNIASSVFHQKAKNTNLRKNVSNANPLSPFLRFFSPLHSIKGDFLKQLPFEMQAHCISYLTPQEKAIFAQVCREAQRLAEDPFLLLKDYQANKELTIKQLSIIFHHEKEPLKSEIQGKIVKLKKFHKTFLIKSKRISKEIAILYTKKKIKLNKVLYEHFGNLCSLEMHLQQSCGSDFPKAPLLQFFNKHLGMMKSRGLKLNDNLYSESCPPLHHAIFGSPKHVRLEV